MSVQKLVTEAERLLEKGKIADGIAKLQQALKQEPLNQIVATKLAHTYVHEGNYPEAVKTFDSLAQRLSDAGKGQVAIAIYKQAIDLAPNDINLRIRFAQECESSGKMADAYIQGQTALMFFLQRKKFFDAAGLLPLLVRAQPKNAKLKEQWGEILELCQADQKLIHFLVAVCGPPGLVSSEFQVGGDPTEISPKLYDQLKRLVLYYPRDPRVAYAMAWAAHRRGRAWDFYHHLKECLRREPNFGLAVLLFSRVFAEEKKLNESLFLYRYFKDNLSSDKSTDLVTLNRLIETFVEKNGWIRFMEDSGDLMSPEGFLEAITGKKNKSASDHPESTPEENSAKPLTPDQKTSSELIAAAPAEIELGSVPEAVPDSKMELVLFSNEMVSDMVKASGGTKDRINPPAKPAESSVALPEVTGEIPKLPPTMEGNLNLVETDPGFASEAPAPSVAPPVVFTPAPAPVERPAPDRPSSNSEATLSSPLEAGIAATESPLDMPPAAPPTAASKGFNPLPVGFEAPASVVTAPPVIEEKEKSVLLSPFALVEKNNAKTIEEMTEEEKTIIAASLHSPASKPPEAAAPVESPLEIPKEESGILMPVFSDLSAAKPTGSESGSIELSLPQADALEMNRPEAKPMDITITGSRISLQDGTDEKTIPPQENLRPATNPEPTLEATPAPPTSAPMALEGAPQEPAAAPASPPSGFDDFAIPTGVGAVFAPIPEMQLQPATPGDGLPKIDLGDDLLEGPTRIYSVPVESLRTEQLIQEMKQDLPAKVDPRLDVETYLKKAERYVAKRNYYLARKALRHALHLGAEEELVKNRLREIRKLEFPEALYNTISSDRPGKEDTSMLLDRLEQEFDLAQGESEETEIGSVVEERIESILQESDPRTILDFGVGLHEMGLFRQAELVFTRLVEGFPEYSFEAYYLAAHAKLARRDYAGAASILKRLTADTARTEIEKIQIYYALGETFEKMQQPDRSKPFFQKVAELDSNYRNIRNKLEE